MNEEMPAWRRYLRFWKADAAGDVDDELSFHLEERAAMNRARGMSADAARREAEERFGNVNRIRRAMVQDATKAERRRGRVEQVAGLVQDIGFSLRGLRRNPYYAMTAVATLALGIGANTATFSVVNAVLLRPLPYGQPDRLVSVNNAWEGDGSAHISPAEYLDYRDVHSFAAFGVYVTGRSNLIDATNPEQVASAAVSAGVFTALGVPAIAGRLFANGAGLPGRDNVALLGENFWRRRFGGERSVLGSSVNIDGRQMTVIGVLPSTFALPEAMRTGEPIDVYVPYDADRATTTDRGSHYLTGVGLLRDGVSRETADADLARTVAGFQRLYPEDYPASKKFSASVEPMRETITGDVKPLLLVLLAGVCFVLLVACANVSSLVLTRTEDRRREMAIRMALGAGRWRLARQLLIEHSVLAALGGVGGLALAYGGTRILAQLQPGDIPRIADVTLDGRVLFFTVAISMVSALLFGAGPSMMRARSSGAVDGGALRDGARTTSTKRTHLVRSSLISLEVALSVVLLAGAGLMLRSFSRLMDVDPGYSTENLLTVPVALPEASYATMQQRRQFFAVLSERATALPGVVDAGGVATLPLEHSTGDINIQIEGREKRATDVSDRLDWNVVTPGYFDAIGIRVVQGRSLSPSDDENAQGAVVLSESAAAQYWPAGDALGKRFTLGGKAGPGMVTVVGIVRDVRQAALSADPTPTMYLAHRQFSFWNGGNAISGMTMVLRTRGSPGALSGDMRNLVRTLDSAVPVGAFTTMDEMIRRSVATPRFTMLVLGVFAGSALVLALVGIYGLISYTVAKRTRELAMRMALGARASRVLLIVIVQALTPVVAGLLIGIPAAGLLSRVLEGMLFDISPTDPVTFAIVLAAIVTTALVAAGVPAVRASRIEPMLALREE